LWIFGLILIYFSNVNSAETPMVPMRGKKRPSEQMGEEGDDFGQVHAITYILLVF